MQSRIKSPQKLRLEIAALAARLLAEDGAANYHAAKKKAAQQLGVTSNKNMPANDEVEQALVDYQSIFHSPARQESLLSLRQNALRAMELLAEFRPCLVGPLVSGTATATSEVTIHLYCDQAEKISLFLNEKGIPTRFCEKQVRINVTDVITCPALRFIADSSPFLLVIFREKDKNLNPISSITGKPMETLDLENLQDLVRDHRRSAGTR